MKILRFLLLLFSLQIGVITTFSQVVIDSYRYQAAITFDTDYQAVLDRGTALGYTLPSSSQQIKQNTLCLCLKSASVWTGLDIFYNLTTDGSEDFATLNWKAPTSFQITKVASPTFTSNLGFDFNSSTQYLNTNWAPGTNGVGFTQNDASVGTYVTESVNGNNISDFGVSNSADGISNGIMFNSRNSSAQAQFRLNDNVTSSLSNASGIGFYHAKRTSSTARDLLKDATSLGSSSQASTTRSTSAIYIGAANGAGTATRFANRSIGMFWAGASLNTLETSFYNCWNTYRTSL